MEVNVHLREGNADALTIKLKFHLLGGIPEHRPVVGILDPGTDVEVDSAVCQRRHIDHRGRIFQYSLILLQNIHQNLLRFKQIIAIADAEHHIHSARITLGVVGDVIGVDFAVGNDDLAVVTGAENGVENGDLLHHPTDTTRFYKVTGLEGTEDDQHHAGGEVLQRVLQRQANDQTCGTDQRDK